jgi:hypothetical protein
MAVCLAAAAVSGTSTVKAIMLTRHRSAETWYMVAAAQYRL